MSAITKTGGIAYTSGCACGTAPLAAEGALGPDVVVIQVAGPFHRVFDHLLGSGRLRLLAHRDHLASAARALLDLQAGLPQLDVEIR